MSFYIIHTKGTIPITHYHVVSIDPGIKNIAVRIELRNDDSIKTIFFKLIDVSHTISPFTYLTEVMESIFELFKDCNIVLIEQQIVKNHKVMRIAQHLLSYFITKFHILEKRPFIVEVNPKLKTIRMPSGSNNKKWSIEEAKRILEKGHDEDGLAVINSSKKKDDLSDTVCQINEFLSQADDLLKQIKSI